MNQSNERGERQNLTGPPPWTLGSFFKCVDALWTTKKKKTFLDVGRGIDRAGFSGRQLIFKTQRKANRQQVSIRYNTYNFEKINNKESHQQPIHLPLRCPPSPAPRPSLSSAATTPSTPKPHVAASPPTAGPVAAQSALQANRPRARSSRQPLTTAARTRTAGSTRTRLFARASRRLARDGLPPASSARRAARVWIRWRIVWGSWRSTTAEGLLAAGTARKSTGPSQRARHSASASACRRKTLTRRHGLTSPDRSLTPFNHRLVGHRVPRRVRHAHRRLTTRAILAPPARRPPRQVTSSLSSPTTSTPTRPRCL